jgi:hypothetical protein
VATAVSNPAEQELSGTPGLRLSRHEVTASPRWIHSTQGFLTAPEKQPVPARQQADPHRVVKAYIEAHRELFGHGADELERARISRDSTGKHNGLRTTVWEQQYEGIPVFEGVFLAHLTRQGELVNVASQFLSDPAAAVAKGQGVDWKAGPRLTAEQALACACTNVGLAMPGGEWVKPVDAPQGAEQERRWTSALLEDNAQTRLVWLPLDPSRARLAWEVVFMPRPLGRMFLTVVDAETGEVWVRHNCTFDISNISLRVFTLDGPTPQLPGYRGLASNSQPASVSRKLVTLAALDTTASPNGWINDGDNQTLGNNVDAHTDLTGTDTADLPRPQGSPFRTFDFGLDLTQDPSTYRKAAIVNLFYWCNWMHDRLYELGFDEASGNFQTDNFGRGGKANDAVLAQSQDGKGTDNANFSCPADGNAGRIRMYLWNGPTPSRDGDFDTTIMLHEYTHGLSGRLVGGGVGISKLQTEGMGEGWSDFYALSLLSPSNGSLSDSYIEGAYVVYGFNNWGSFQHDGDNYYFGLRRYPYSTNLSVNPLTFKDIDPPQISPHSGVPRSPIFAGIAANEVHCSGEVWCATLWEARAELIAKYGYSTGNNLILQLVTDGMKLSPPNPTFTEARDAVLAADQALDGGANQSELWRAFAKRGLGVYAVGGVNTSSSVTEDFTVTADPLRVLGVKDPSVSGVFRGPWSVSPTLIALTNQSGASLSWDSRADSLLSLAPELGTLAGHGTAQVEVMVNKVVAASLPVGYSQDLAVQFSNRVSHVTQDLSFGSSITEPLELRDQTNGSPASTYTMQGLLGGPFPLVKPVLLANDSDLPMSWAASVAQPFLLSPSSGTIPGHTVIPLNLTAGAAASTLPYGAYKGELDLTNETSGSSLSANLELYIFNNGYLTQEIAQGYSSNLLNTCLTFTPDGSPQYYSVCRTSVSEFPTDPTGGAELHNGGYGTGFDAYADVVLTNGASVSLFGYQTNHVLVTFLGCVNLDQPDANYDCYKFDSSQYWARRRIAPVYWGFDRSGSGNVAGASVSWKQLPDRFVVTWQNICGPSDPDISSFQAELFFDGTIRMTIVHVPTNLWFTPTVGLWRGAGRPDDFTSTDFAGAVDCGAALPSLSITAPASYTEGQYHLLNEGRVSIPAPIVTNLTVQLTSADTNQCVVPVCVIIPAGATNASFNLDIMDDHVLGGTQLAAVGASAPGYAYAETLVLINDKESTPLYLETPSKLKEGGDASFAAVYTGVPVGKDVLVTLSSQPPGQILFGGLVPFAVIPKGQTSAAFTIQAMDHHRIDGSCPVQVIASVANWPSATNTLTVLYHENTNLSLLTAPIIVVGTGMLSNAAVVSLAGTLSTDLTVQVTCDNLSAVWALGPVTIPAGQTNAFFNLFAWPDPTIEPTRLVTFTASAPGFATGQWASFLLDIRGPPIALHPSPLLYAEDVPLDVSLSWGPGEGELMVNGGFESLLDHWTREDIGAGGWVGANSTYKPVGSEPAQGPLSGSGYALSQQYGNGQHALWQQVDLPLAAWPITLSWSQRLHNHALAWATNQQFRVELREPTTNGVLATLYTTSTNDPLAADWTNRVVDLTGFGGQTVRVAFVEQDALGQLNVSLDDVSLLATPPAPTTWLVYFGTNATPGSGQYVGSTTNTTWPLGTLATNTTYYWLVCSVRAGLTNPGPIWQFTTLDYTNRPPVVTLGAPADFSIYHAPTNLSMTCGTVDAAAVTNVQFYGDLALLGSAVFARAWNFTWTNPLPGEHAIFAVAYDNAGLCATSAVRCVSVAPSSGALMDIVPFGSTWSYSDTGTNLGMAWRAGGRNGFDDTAWPSGPGPLGYGHGNEATRVDYGPDFHHKYITTYFRHSFGPIPNAQSLILRVLRDDGVAVYLNGFEVLRDNLSGSAAYDTLAADEISGAAEDVLVSRSTSPVNLGMWYNVLAAEVHQAAPDGEDLAFDLDLGAVMYPPATVTLVTPAPNSVYLQPTNMALVAAASAPYGVVAQVQFFSDGLNLGTVSNAPYALVWTNAAAGTHTITAVVTDGQGMTYPSADTLVFVLSAAPSLAISPGPGGGGLWWPGAAMGYHLESTANLAPPVQWLPWTNSLPVLKNNRFYVPLPPAEDTQRFFRLAAP